MAKLEWMEDLEQMGNIPIIGDMYRCNYAMLTWIFAISKFMSFPTYVFLHKNIGERTYSIISLWYHLILITLVSYDLMGAIQQSLGLQSAPTAWLSINLLYWVFIGLLAKHWYMRRKREKEGKNIHSRYVGDSFGFWQHMPFGNRPTITQGIYEPALLIAMAYGLSALGMTSGATAFYLTTCGLSAALTVRLGVAYERAQYLDEVDAELEMKFKSALSQGRLLNGKEAQGVQSYSLASSSPEKQKMLLEQIKTRCAQERRQKHKEMMGIVEGEEDSAVA